MSLIKCEKLTLSYDGKPIISDLSFSINNGDYLCIIGENGAGKTTLTKGLLGLLKPISGEINYGDGLFPNEIGFLPQQSDIQKDFPASVFEVVLSGCLNKCGLFSFYKKEHKQTARRNMSLLGISNISKSCYHELSGGQQQRVLLARALCATGKLLVLDEPVSGLDPVVTAEFYSLISHLNKQHNISIVMVSHDISGALSNASHILHLEHNDHYFGTAHDYLDSDFSKKFLS